MRDLKIAESEKITSSLDALKKFVAERDKLDTSSRYEDRFVAENHNADMLETQRDGLAKRFALRGVWSTVIIIWITLLIVFHCALTIAVGAGKLNFDNLQWFITMVTMETFLQVVDLGYVAAKFLFSDPSGSNS